MDAEVQAIKRDAFAALQAGNVVMLVKTDYGYRVEQWFPDGVAPQNEYDTPNEALARAAQLLGVKDPIVPQDWPERVCIGTVSTKPDNS